MRIEINKVVKQIDLGDRAIAILMPKARWDRFKDRWFPAWLLRYFPVQFERKAEEIHVWMNPPRSLRFKLSKGIALASNEDRVTEASELMFGALSELWSQHDLVLSADEVRSLAFYLLDQDPGMWSHLVNETLRMIADRIAQEEKK